jgi:hypothetical protein
VATPSVHLGPGPARCRCRSSTGHLPAHRVRTPAALRRWLTAYAAATSCTKIAEAASAGGTPRPTCTVTDSDTRHLLWLQSQLGSRLCDAVVVTAGQTAYRTTRWGGSNPSSPPRAVAAEPDPVAHSGHGGGQSDHRANARFVRLKCSGIHHNLGLLCVGLAARQALTDCRRHLSYSVDLGEHSVREEVGNELCPRIGREVSL